MDEKENKRRSSRISLFRRRSSTNRKEQLEHEVDAIGDGKIREEQEQEEEEEEGEEEEEEEDGGGEDVDNVKDRVNIKRMSSRSGGEKKGGNTTMKHLACVSR